MQNVQNAEIQQRVKNLVDLYRTKVGKESHIAKEAKADRDFWEQESIDMMIEDGISMGGMYGEGPHTEDWVKHLMVNEQLLGHFYAEFAGDNADKDVLSELLPEVYDKTIFTKEEESFLKLHFKEMVNYIIVTPNDESLEFVNRYDNRDAFVIPNEVLELIANRAKIVKGSKIYNPNTGFAQFINLYKDCKFFCDDKNAWMQVAIYANNADVEILKYDDIPTSYDAIVSYLPNIVDDSIAVPHLCEAYKKLPLGGMFLLICPPNLLSDRAHTDFRKILVKDRAIKEIIQLPEVMGNNASFDTYCLIIAQKGRKENVVTLIDARTAYNDINTKHYMLLFDNEKFDAILKNGGMDSNTGLRNVIQVSSDDLSQDILIPQVYVIERPSKEERPVPLSTLCSFVSNRISDVQFDLPEDTPWINETDLTPLFVGELDITGIRKVDCPNNPPFVEDSKDYAFKDGKFFDSVFAQMATTKGNRVLNYRECTYLDGKSDAVLYEYIIDNTYRMGVRMALVRATRKPIAVSKSILVFTPKEGIDANTLYAALRLPIVYRQMLAYKEYGIENHLADILVPLDKRIIGDELYRMTREQSATKELKDDFEAGQKRYKEKLENYQHVMRKHIRPISSSIRRMERYINRMESSEEIKSFLHERLEVIMTNRLYLSEDIERLNEENTYGDAVPYDIDHCLKGFKDYFGSDGYPIVYSNEIAKDALKRYLESSSKEISNMNDTDRDRIIESVYLESSVSYVDIAEYNFGKVVRNILENARVHGFSTNTSRNDYKIEIVLTWNFERKMYQIDFRNNGDPLPEGLSKESYGENRKYAGKTGGTGIGGYEVADTVKHYKGDYAISQEGDWVVVSIYLPKSKSYEEGV